MSPAAGSPGKVPSAAAPPHARGNALFVVGVALLALAGYLAWQHFAGARWIQTYRVVHEYPHDPEAYCQGLVFDGGLLYESTGLNGRSSVRTVELESGKVLKKTTLPPILFGEGLALVGERLIQLTWKNQAARIYDKATLKALDQFEYTGEGWGLAYDGQNLIHSDGTENLVFRDPQTFKEVRRVRVTARGAPVRNLNELELVEGEIWANIWHTDRIARIDPASGNVLGFVDLTGIIDKSTLTDAEAVLNGIAYDPGTKRLFVTGKLWPKLFEIEVVAQ